MLQKYQQRLLEAVDLEIGLYLVGFLAARPVREVSKWPVSCRVSTDHYDRCPAVGYMQMEHEVNLVKDVRAKGQYCFLESGRQGRSLRILGYILGQDFGPRVRSAGPKGDKMAGAQLGTNSQTLATILDQLQIIVDVSVPDHLSEI